MRLGPRHHQVGWGGPKLAEATNAEINWLGCWVRRHKRLNPAHYCLAMGWVVRSYTNPSSLNSAS